MYYPNYFINNNTWFSSTRNWKEKSCRLVFCRFILPIMCTTRNCLQATSQCFQTLTWWLFLSISWSWFTYLMFPAAILKFWTEWDCWKVSAARCYGINCHFVDGNSINLRRCIKISCTDFDKMMQGVHLVGEDEEDIYGGFDDYNPAFETEVNWKM